MRFFPHETSEVEEAKGKCYKPAANAQYPGPEVDLSAGVPAHLSPSPRAKQETSECRPDQTPWWKNLCDGIIALAALGALGVYLLQYKESRSVAHSQLSIDRPLVGAAEVDHLELHDGTHIIQQTWRNFGASPAKDLHVKWTWLFEPPSDLKNIAWKKEFSGVSPVIKDLGIVDSIVLTLDDRQKITTNGHFVGVGVLTYKDYFPCNQGETHVVHYCTRFSQITGPIEHFAWTRTEPCTKFRCVDQECGKDYEDEQK